MPKATECWVFLRSKSIPAAYLVATAWCYLEYGCRRTWCPSRAGLVQSGSISPWRCRPCYQWCEDRQFDQTASAPHLQDKTHKKSPPGLMLDLSWCCWNAWKKCRWSQHRLVTAALTCDLSFLHNEGNDQTEGAERWIHPIHRDDGIIGGLKQSEGRAY